MDVVGGLEVLEGAGELPAGEETRQHTGACVCEDRARLGNHRRQKS